MAEPLSLAEMPRRQVVSIEHVWAGYNQDIVLEDINLAIWDDDFIGLIGPNGGGKTTLIRVLLGMLSPLKGSVRILGRSVQEGRRYIGYVPQLVQFDREFPISVWDVARMGRLGKRGLGRRFTSEDNDLVAQSLESVQMLHHRDRPIGDLSGGQRQRVYIARALAARPAILLLDEPTSSVDPEASESIYQLLSALNEQMAILMVSHDMGAISSYVKTVGCLNRKLFYHGGGDLTPDMIDQAYMCPIDLVAHGVPHRVFSEHLHEHLHTDGTPTSEVKL